MRPSIEVRINNQYFMLSNDFTNEVNKYKDLNEKEQVDLVFAIADIFNIENYNKTIIFLRALGVRNLTCTPSKMVMLKGPRNNFWNEQKPINNVSIQEAYGIVGLEGLKILIDPRHKGTL